MSSNLGFNTKCYTEFYSQYPYEKAGKDTNGLQSLRQVDPINIESNLFNQFKFNLIKIYNLRVPGQGERPGLQN